MTPLCQPASAVARCVLFASFWSIASSEDSQFSQFFLRENDPAFIYCWKQGHSRDDCCGHGASAAAAALCFDSIYTWRECCGADGWARLFPTAQPEAPSWGLPPTWVSGSKNGLADKELLRKRHPSFSRAQREWEVEMQNSSKVLSRTIFGINLRFFMFKRSDSDFEESLQELQDDEYRLLNVGPPSATGAEDSSPLVVDIGASIGILAVLLARLWPTTRVVAVEAAPANYRYLLWNLRVNGVADRVWPMNVAIGGAPLAARSFYYSPTYPRTSQATMLGSSAPDDEVQDAQKPENGDDSWRGGWVDWQARFEVEQLTFAELLGSLDLRGVLHYLKVDCEGCEWDIFAPPSWPRLRHRARHIAVELHRWALDDSGASRQLEASVREELCTHELRNGPDFYMCSTT
eukprot:TRINITY_DN15769_c0_g1_i1.p1 TRINITY_DN15769_c0_g1~~TRINITY_DN15769_c0_g1_i1.p1  ORF type:complete len:429 (-),score=67.52 TRINITY_DN15769_c0_g1_i1:38-1252(-)